MPTITQPPGSNQPLHTAGEPAIVLSAQQLQRLRAKIGEEVMYSGLMCEIIEVLEDIPALVVQTLDNTPRIQTNQLGEAHRRTRKTFTVPLMSKHNQGPAFAALPVDE